MCPIEISNKSSSRVCTHATFESLADYNFHSLFLTHSNKKKAGIKTALSLQADNNQERLEDLV